MLRCKTERSCDSNLTQLLERHCSPTQCFILTILDHFLTFELQNQYQLAAIPQITTTTVFPSQATLHTTTTSLFQQTNHTKDRSTFNICVSFSTNPCASLCISAATLCTPASLPCISLSRFTRATIFSDDSRSVFDNSRSVSSRFARVCDDRASPAALRPPRPPDQLTTRQSPRESAQALTFSSGTKSWSFAPPYRVYLAIPAEPYHVEARRGGPVPVREGNAVEKPLAPAGPHDLIDGRGMVPSVRSQHQHRRVALEFRVHVHRVGLQLAVQATHRIAIGPHRPLRRPRQRLHAARTARAARAARTRRRPHRPRGAGKSRGFTDGVGTGSRGNPRRDGFRNGGRRGDGGGEARAVGGVDGSRGNSRFLGRGVGAPRGALNTAIYGHGLDGSGTTEGCR